MPIQVLLFFWVFYPKDQSATCRPLLPGEAIEVGAAELRRLCGDGRGLRGLFGLRGADRVAGAHRAPLTTMGWDDLEIWGVELEIWRSLAVAFGGNG